MTAADTPIFDAAFWLTAASRGKLRAQADRGSTGAALALKVTEDNERLIGAVLLGNNVMNILSASLATALLTRVFGTSSVALATLVMTFLVLIFAEVLPKTHAITNPEAASARVAPAIQVVIFLFTPIVSSIRALVRLVLALFGVKTDPDANILALREEIAGAIALGHSEGAVHKEDRDRLLGALDLSDRTVEEIMRHRSEIDAIDADLPPQEILAKSLASPYTRMPLYRGEHENIIEEIIGEITDETDTNAENPLKQTESGDYLVEGSMTIRDLNRATDWSLPDDEANTVAGLVIHEAQMIPNEGQVFSFHGFRFEVITRRENRITRLKIRPL